MNNILILGMSRGGTHAFANWIQAMLPDHKFYNHCGTWIEGYLVDMRENTVKPPFIATIEDFDPHDFEQYQFKNFPSLRQTHVVYLCRDPFNWLASSVKHWDYEKNTRNFVSDMGDDKPSRIEIYKRHIKQPYVNYNRWFNDILYRQEIAITQLGLSFSDDGLNIVSQHGKGSSFDGMQFQHKAQAMDVLNRWKEYRFDEKFQDLFDRDLRLIGSNHFNLCPF